MRGLRGPGPVLYHAEGGHDGPGDPPVGEFPDADGVLPAAGGGGGPSGLCLPHADQDPGTAEYDGPELVAADDGGQLPGVWIVLLGGVPPDLQHLL